MKAKEQDYIKAVKRADREYEIEMHGKQISMRSTKISKSKKAYNRNEYKRYKIEY